MTKNYKTPQVGDMAWHKNGYDPREVTRIEGPYIGLRISEDTEAFPCPVENYTFTRPADAS